MVVTGGEMCLGSADAPVLTGRRRSCHNHDGCDTLGETDPSGCHGHLYGQLHGHSASR